MANAKVSVIIPAYNCASYTVETVESVLNQTYANIEIIVVDDGSTDNTGEELKKFAGVIQYIYKENGGACSARNLGIGLSTGEYIACLDCDDLWLPEKLEHSLAVLEACPELALVFTACYLIDSEGNISGQERCHVDLRNGYRQLFYENYIAAPTVVMRRSCLGNVGLFDEDIFIPADWDLWLRLSRLFPIGYIDKPLSKYRVTSNYSARNLQQFFEESMYVIEKNIKICGDLSVGEQNKIYRTLFWVFSLLHFKAGNWCETRSMLKRSIDCDPYQGRAYYLYILTYFWRQRKSIITHLKLF
jgi:glycosyltransferase involved in cell wall biosynthesis